MARLLVVYYSLSGNTERIAKRLAYRYDAERVVKIETVAPYTGSYDDIVDQGKREVESGYQPEIRLIDAESGEAATLDLDEFDAIAIGTPTWWYTYAPAVAAFLKMFDWNERVVIPFQTHGGWKGHVMGDFKKACVGVVLRDKFDIQFDSTGGRTRVTPDSEIDKWITSLSNI